MVLVDPRDMDFIYGQNYAKSDSQLLLANLKKHLWAFLFSGYLGGWERGECEHEAGAEEEAVGRRIGGGEPGARRRVCL